MHYINQSMQRKIVAVVAIFLFLVSSISIFIQIQSINVSAKADFEKGIKELARIFSVVMATPVRWESMGEQPALKSNTEAMFADPKLLMASVYMFHEDKKRFYFKVYRDSETNKKVYFTRENKDISFQDSVTRQIPIFRLTQLSRNYVSSLIHDPFEKTGEREIIGYVDIEYSTFAFDQQRNTAISRTIVNTALAFAVILIVLTLLLKRLVSDPLAKVSHLMNDVAKGHYDNKVDIYQSPDEVGQIVADFEAMRIAIQKKIKDLHDLNHTSEMMAKLHDQEQALKAGLQILEEHANVTRGSVYLYKKETQHLVIKASYPPVKDEANLAPIAFRLGEGIAGEVAQHKKYIFIRDSSQEKRFIAHTADNNPSTKRDPIALLCVPMLDENELFGVMNFSGPISQVHFEEDVREFAETIARMMVVTCKNIQMVDTIEGYNKNLEKKVEDRTAELKKTNEELAKEVDLRKQAEARLQEFLSAHEKLGDGLIKNHFNKNE